MKMEKVEYPKIKKVYSGRFPENFVNDVQGWGFSEKELKENLGQLLTLDIDFGSYCSLNCPHCFRCNNQVDKGPGKRLNFDDLQGVIVAAKKLGLRSVKFLGAGEPMQSTRFVEFLRFLKDLDVIPLIFTKGHVIGDDEEVAKWNRQYGITTGEQLVAELDRVNASILLGFNSFSPVVQDKMVGGIDGYTAIRNRALELLATAGFNKCNPTRLALIGAPITNDNIGNILEMYKWARVRNLHFVSCPTMVSGRSRNNWKTITPPQAELEDLYTEMYEFNLDRGIHTRDSLRQEGISPYSGCRPCNQVACGMYITLTGKVLRCPGDDVTVFGDITKQSIAEIWQGCENYHRQGTFNCGCPPKMGKSFAFDFFKRVEKKLGL
jgi:MoaA/NifB/PqqE/SkfB family radical SAM enzyme